MEILSLAALSSVALGETVKFLYGQAGELLKRRRDRADMADAPAATPPVVAEPAALPEPDPALVDRFEADLRSLRADLQEYAAGVDPIDPSDTQLLARADALRRVLEVIHGTAVVFEGEPPGSTVVRGSIDAVEVAGYVAAVRADTADKVAGSIEGHARVGRVAAGGEAVGVDIGADRHRNRP